MKSRYHTPPEVEPAVEVNEASTLSSPEPVKPSNKPAVKPSTSQAPLKVVNTKNNKKGNSKQSSVVIPPPNHKEVQMKVINMVNSTSEVIGAPSADPLGLRKD